MSRKRSELYAQLGWARRTETELGLIASLCEHSKACSNNNVASLSPDSPWHLPQSSLSTTIRAAQRRPTSTPAQTRAEHSNSARAGLATAGSGRATAVTTPSGMALRPQSRQWTPGITADPYSPGQTFTSDIEPSILEHCAGLRPTLLSLDEEQLPDSRSLSPKYHPPAIAAWKEVEDMSSEEQGYTYTQARQAANGGRDSASPHFLWSSPGSPLGEPSERQGFPSREGSSLGGLETPTGTRSRSPNGLNFHRKAKRHHVKLQDILVSDDVCDHLDPHLPHSLMLLLRCCHQPTTHHPTTIMHTIHYAPYPVTFGPNCSHGNRPCGFDP